MNDISSQICSAHLGTSPGLKSCLSGSSLTGMVDNVKNTITRNVSFDNIEIREYERVLGDNPSVTSGVPISIGWKYHPDRKIVDVDDYETNRKPRKVSDEMKMPESVREQILKQECGLSARQLVMAVEEINVTKSKRRTTAASDQGKEKRDELLEAGFRKIRRFVTGNSKKKQEERLWKNAEKYDGIRV